MPAPEACSFLQQTSANASILQKPNQFPGESTQNVDFLGSVRRTCVRGSSLVLGKFCQAPVEPSFIASLCKVRATFEISYMNE